MSKPKLRFPEFSAEWNELELGDIVVQNIEPIPMPKTGYTRVGIYCHAKGTFQEYVPEGKGLDVDVMYVVHKDNLIVNITFAWEHAIAITKPEDEGKIVSHRFPTYKFNEGHLPEFYRYLILDKRMEYHLMVASPGGAGRNRVLNKTEFLKIPVNVPDTKEQKKIADAISSMEDVITLIEKEVALWEEKKKGVMQKIFSQEVKFKKEDGSQYPEWEEQEVGNLGEFIKGAPLSKADISETGTPFILYGELYTTYKEVAYEIKRRTKAVVEDKYYSKMGDVVIPTSGESAEEISTATCVMKEGVILAGDLNIFRSDLVDGRIMSYILNCQARNKIAKIAQGKSIVHIQAKELGKVKVQYPIDSEEQEKIAELLFTVDEVIQIKKQKLETWKNIKKGLLQQMFV